jgi:hypothetical protein
MHYGSADDAANTAFDDVGQYLLERLIGVVGVMLLCRDGVFLTIVMMRFVNIRHFGTSTRRNGRDFNTMDNFVAGSAALLQMEHVSVSSSSQEISHQILGYVRARAIF